MINFKFFPRSNGVTPQIRDIINCFKKVDENRDENVLWDMYSSENDYLNKIKEIFKDKYILNDVKDIVNI